MGRCINRGVICMNRMRMSVIERCRVGGMNEGDDGWVCIQSSASLCFLSRNTCLHVNQS
jgi:hypothetical protein